MHSISTNRYPKYAVVAIVAFIVTLGIRELLAAVLQTDTPGTYVSTIVVAYGLGVMANFELQREITFRGQVVGTHTRLFAGFVLVAALGAGITAAVAAILRYGGNFDELFGALGDTLAFGAATVVSSILTYRLNASWVFRASAEEHTLHPAATTSNVGAMDDKRRSDKHKGKCVTRRRATRRAN